MSDEVQRPTSDEDRAGWKTWRKEPEIDEERRRFLTVRRAIIPRIEKGMYPFRNESGPIKLTRADVEWLLATHESGGYVGPVNWSDQKQRERIGLDLRGADLRGVDLSGMPLARARGGLTFAEWPESSFGGYGTILEQAAVQLENANLSGAHMEQMLLREVNLSHADLSRASLDRATLYHARLQGANLGGATLSGANLRRASFDAETNLYGVVLSSKRLGAAAVRDARWNGADLSVVAWEAVPRLGDERILSTKRTLSDYQNIVRANRQMALVLRSQALSEHADTFAYQAQVVQRQVRLRQGKVLRYLGSRLLDVISGFGYKPLRSFIAYVVIICAFAGAYLFNAQFAAPHLTWDEALVLSISAFHGRGFFTSGISLGDTLARLAAGEAIIGLLIEITFIGAIRSLETVTRRRGMRGIPSGMTTGCVLTSANSCPSW